MLPQVATRSTLCDSALQARKNAKAAGQAFYDVGVLQALAGTLGQALPESLRPRASALSPHQVRIAKVSCVCARRRIL